MEVKEEMVVGPAGLQPWQILDPETLRTWCHLGQTLSLKSHSQIAAFLISFYRWHQDEKLDPETESCGVCGSLLTMVCPSCTLRQQQHVHQQSKRRGETKQEADIGRPQLQEVDNQQLQQQQPQQHERQQPPALDSRRPNRTNAASMQRRELHVQRQKKPAVKHRARLKVVLKDVQAKGRHLKGETPRERRQGQRSRRPRMTADRTEKRGEKNEGARSLRSNNSRRKNKAPKKKLTESVQVKDYAVQVKEEPCDTLADDDDVEDSGDVDTDVYDEESYSARSDAAPDRVMTEEINNVLENDPNKPGNIRDRKTYKCKDCGREFRTALKLETHCARHKPCVCDICHKSYANRARLKQHKMIHAGKKNYGCELCSKPFLTKAHLKQHLLIHSGRKQFVCDACPKSFATVAHLKQHQFIHSAQKPHMCETCGKGFAYFSALEQHKIIHTGQKPFVCEFCNKGFSMMVGLRNHRVIHTRQEGCSTHVCETCGKAFVSSNGLKYHRAVHTGVKPFECDVCHKAFARASHYRQHKLIHTGQKPHMCTVCSKAFTQSGDLKRHQMTHTGHKPHKCDLCHLTFTQASYLRKHRTTHDGNPNIFASSHADSEDRVLNTSPKLHNSSMVDCKSDLVRSSQSSPHGDPQSSPHRDLQSLHTSHESLSGSSVNPPHGRGHVVPPPFNPDPTPDHHNPTPDHHKPTPDHHTPMPDHHGPTLGTRDSSFLKTMQEFSVTLPQAAHNNSYTY